MDLQSLKPSRGEVLRMARAEASVEQCARFAPICRGPGGNLLIAATVVIAALPSIVWRAGSAAARRLLRGS